MSKLDRLRNRYTRYEIILTHKDFRSILVGYTARKSFPGLLAMVQQQGPKIVSLLGISDAHRMTRERGGLDFGNGWRASFSGRTQRDAYIDGERPFVGNMADLALVD